MARRQPLTDDAGVGQQTGSVAVPAAAARGLWGRLAVELEFCVARPDGARAQNGTYHRR